LELEEGHFDTANGLIIFDRPFDMPIACCLRARRDSRRPLPEIPRPHLDRVDVQVRHVDIPRLRRKAARIDARAAVMEFVAASVWQKKTVVSVTYAGKVR
jgi:hypothetical protein